MFGGYLFRIVQCPFVCKLAFQVFKVTDDVASYNDNYCVNWVCNHNMVSGTGRHAAVLITIDVIAISMGIHHWILRPYKRVQ